MKLLNLPFTIYHPVKGPEGPNGAFSGLLLNSHLSFNSWPPVIDNSQVIGNRKLLTEPTKGGV